MAYEFYAPEPGRFEPDKAKLLLGSDLLGLDTEYTGYGLYQKGAFVRLVQFATLDSMVVLDMLDSHQRKFAQDVLSDRRRTYVCHNATGAEIPAVQKAFGIDISYRVIDTMILALLAYPGEFNDHGLKFFAPHVDDGAELVEYEERLWQEHRKLWKAKTGTFVGKEQEIKSYGFTYLDSRNPIYLKYAGLDALTVRRILSPMLRRLASIGVPTSTIDFEQEVNGIAARMAIRGMQIDMQRRDDILADVGVRHNDAKRRFEDQTNGINPRSPEREEYFRERGVEFRVFNPPKKDGTRSAKLGHEELKELALEYPLPEMITLLDFAETMNATLFLTAVEKHTDAANRLHPSIRTLGAVSGRWQVSKPGVQTVSNKSGARKVFIPWSYDYVKLHADLGQIEPRIAFTIAGQKDAIELMKTGEDAYGAAARMIFGEGYTSFQRKLTKRVILGTLYGSGISTLVRQAKYVDGWADANPTAIGAARNQFRKANPRVMALNAGIQKDADIRLPSGRWAPHDPNRMYRAINCLVQGTARDALMERVVDMSRGGLDDYLIMTYHDEVELMLPRRDFDTSSAFVREVMEKGFYGTPTPADLEVYDTNWGEAPRLLEAA